MSDATDRVEITDLLNRHQIYIDLADTEGYAGLYAPNGAYESPFGSATGRTDIAKMFRNLRASGFTANKQHFTGPIMIEAGQDRATALSYRCVADYANEHPTVFANGTYKDDLRKRDGVWTIARRVQSMDSDNARGAQ
jgi:hypothetical protein